VHGVHDLTGFICPEIYYKQNFGMRLVVGVYLVFRGSTVRFLQWMGNSSVQVIEMSHVGQIFQVTW